MMSKEFTDIVMAVFTIVLALATIGLAFVTYLLAKYARHDSRQREIQNAASAAESILSNMRLAITAQPGTSDFFEALNSVHGLALKTKLGLYDLGIIKEFAGPSIWGYYKELEPRIVDRRRVQNTPMLYNHVEDLARYMKPPTA